MRACLVRPQPACVNPRLPGARAQAVARLCTAAGSRQGGAQGRDSRWQPGAAGPPTARPLTSCRAPIRALPVQQRRQLTVAHSKKKKRDQHDDGDGQGNGKADEGPEWEFSKLSDTELAERLLARVDEMVRYQDELRQGMKEILAGTAAIAETMARMSFAARLQPGYWQCRVVTTADELFEIVSSEGRPAEQGPVVARLLEGDSGYLALRRLVLDAFQEQAPAVGTLASQFGQGSGAEWWLAEESRLEKVEAFLLEQPEIAGQGVRWWRQWWRPYVSMLQAYCRVAAEAEDDPAGDRGGLRDFLLRERRGSSPLLMMVVALAAGQLRSSLDFGGEPRLEVQGGVVVSVEMMEVKPSSKELAEALQQLQVVGRVLVWMLHVANPKLLEAAGSAQLQLRGVLAVQESLAAEERQQCAQGLDVGCPGLDASMRLEVLRF